MKNRTIFSVINNLSVYGGAEKILLDVHNGLKEHMPAKIIGFQDFETLHPKLRIPKVEYIKFTNPFVLHNTIVIVHARNIIPLFLILKKSLFLNTTIVYVSHSVYSTLRHVTLFPENIVSISNKVTENLIHYFSVKNKHINLIYNGLADTVISGMDIRKYSTNNIKILYAGRINESKRQVYLVRHLADQLLSQIEIHFAGIGENYELLKQLCESSSNFVALGFIEDMNAIIPNYDYVMLYSTQEGLPLSLIEGAMHSKPLLVNDVGGNLEISIPNFNGHKLSEHSNELLTQLNELVNITEEEYQRLACNSRRRYEEKFTQATMITQYLELIHNLSENS